MQIISHRGNLHGRQTCIENSPSSINDALNLGLDCEIDVWVEKNSILLGHDFGEYSVSLAWLSERASRLWLHLKNREALEYFSTSNSTLHYFWHEEDSYTITSKGLVWIYPGKPLLKNGIAVLPETSLGLAHFQSILKSIPLYGICTDSPIEIIRSNKV